MDVKHSTVRVQSVFSRLFALRILAANNTHVKQVVVLGHYGERRERTLRKWTHDNDDDADS